MVSVTTQTGTRNGLTSGVGNAVMDSLKRIRLKIADRSVHRCYHQDARKGSHICSVRDTSNPTIGGEGMGQKYPPLHGECDQKGTSGVWDRIYR